VAPNQEITAPTAEGPPPVAPASLADVQELLDSLPATWADYLPLLRLGQRVWSLTQ
jgi:hypothetical protein